MPISLNLQNKLTHHLQEKLNNRPWLSECLEGTSTSFPYRVKSGGKAEVGKHLYIPKNQPKTKPKMGEDNDPHYVVNVPMAHKREDDDTDQFTDLLKIFRNQSFGKTAASSKKEVNKRLAVVVGINQIESIDASVNENFRNYISKLPVVEDIPYRAYGFFWKPEWEEQENAPKKVYSSNTAYKLLKALDNDKAIAVRDECEGKEKLHADIVGQIPFQQIRETILKSKSTTVFANHFQEKSETVPIYYGVMDADCQQLRTDEGYFSRTGTVIEDNDNPSAVSLGYSVSEDELPLIRLGIEIDMKVREAMTSVIPYSAYLPEPGSFFRIRKPEENHTLKKLSFIGAGRTLENRRLIANGLAEDVLDKTVAFVADGGVTMGTPGRMKTKKNRQVEVLSPEKVKLKKNLQSLRGVSQTHASPKPWADEVYTAIDFSKPQVTDVTTPMMNIFKVYDPISRMFDMQGRYKAANFDKVMKEHKAALSKSRSNTLERAKTQLTKLGMTKTKINLIVKAAQKSGEAIHKVLQEHTQEEE